MGSRLCGKVGGKLHGKILRERKRPQHAGVPLQRTEPALIQKLRHLVASPDDFPAFHLAADGRARKVFLVEHVVAGLELCRFGTAANLGIAVPGQQPSKQQQADEAIVFHGSLQVSGYPWAKNSIADPAQS